MVLVGWPHLQVTWVCPDQVAGWHPAHAIGWHEEQVSIIGKLVSF